MDVDAQPRLWTWRRLAAVTLAKVVVVGLLGLAAWGALPALVGWHPTTVSSGSMMPRLHVGDIAVSRPLGTHVPPLTSVLLFHDPDHPGRLRMHRFVRLDDDGLLVTRGDANNADDSTPVALSSVIGIGTLRVPWIALPIVWLREGQWLGLALVAAGLGLALAVATSSRDRTFGDDDDPSDPPLAGDSGDGSGPVAPDPGASVAVRARTARGRPGRGALGHLVALVGAGLLAAVLGTPADAAFRDTASTTTALGAAPYFTCANATAALNPYFWYRMDETSSLATAAADSSGGARTGVYSLLGKTTTTSRACDRDTGRALTFNGSSGYLSSRALPSGKPNVFTLAIWFRTTTRSGGKLIGLGNTQSGASSIYDRHLYLSNAGRVYFGVYDDAVKTISSPTAYNDGSWHLAVATLSPAGMRLYLDGDLVDDDPTTTSGEPGTTAYVRVAYDNLDNWTAAPSSRFLAATLDDAVYVPAALTASQVSALYEAGTS